MKLSKLEKTNYPADRESMERKLRIKLQGVNLSHLMCLSYAFNTNDNSTRTSNCSVFINLLNGL